MTNQHLYSNHRTPDDCKRIGFMLAVRVIAFPLAVWMAGQILNWIGGK